LDAQGLPVNLSQDDLQRIQDVLTKAYAESTAASYGSGILVFHVFCDRKEIPEIQRAPASHVLLASFVATLAGTYAGNTIANYLHAIHAWHIVHGAPWNINKQEMDALLKAANSLAPLSSKRLKRDPLSVLHIEQISLWLDLNLPLDAAVFACLTTTFWSTSRLGEMTVTRLDAFDPNAHVKRASIQVVEDRNGLRQTEFFLPKTKSAPNGETVSWARQLGPSDPSTALDNHLRVNDPLLESALFSYRHHKELRPLTRSAFLKQIKQAASGIDDFPHQGHSIRVGSTLEYLLRGVPFDVVKVKGHWASDAFLLYLRKHAQILAPYMQAAPELQDSFIRYTMPPVR